MGKSKLGFLVSYKVKKRLQGASSLFCGLWWGSSRLEGDVMLGEIQATKTLAESRPSLFGLRLLCGANRSAHKKRNSSNTCLPGEMRPRR